MAGKACSRECLLCSMYAVLIKKDGARGLSLATRGPDVMVKVKVKGNNGGDWVEDSMKVVNMAGN